MQPPTGGGLSWWALVVIAASRRSRRRSLPLRGSHGRGLFCTDTKTTENVASHVTSAFLSQEPAWGLRLFAALAPPGTFFGEVVEDEKLSRKSHPPGRGRWSCGSLRRTALEVTAVFLRTRSVVTGSPAVADGNLAVKIGVLEKLVFSERGRVMHTWRVHGQQKGPQSAEF